MKGKIRCSRSEYCLPDSANEMYKYIGITDVNNNMKMGQVAITALNVLRLTMFNKLYNELMRLCMLNRRGDQIPRLP